jgi:hypothetical protein
VNAATSGAWNIDTSWSSTSSFVLSVSAVRSSLLTIALLLAEDVSTALESWSLPLLTVLPVMSVSVSCVLDGMMFDWMSLGEGISPSGLLSSRSFFFSVSCC